MRARRFFWIVVSIYHMPLDLSNMAGCVVDWNGGQAVAGGVAVWSFKFKCKGCAVYKIESKAFHRCLGARRCLCVVSLYHSGTKYRTIVQYLLLVFTIFEALEGPIYGGNELETSNCN
jgi:hypothetical protein